MVLHGARLATSFADGNSLQCGIGVGEHDVHRDGACRLGEDTSTRLITYHGVGNLYRVGSVESYAVFAFEIGSGTFHLSCHPDVGNFDGASRLVGHLAFDDDTILLCALL